MPRRPTSRPRVPAGTFAIAGSVAGSIRSTRRAGGTRGARRWIWSTHCGRGMRSGSGGAPPTRRRRRRKAPPGRRRSTGAPGDPRPLATTVGPYDLSRLERGMPPGGPFDPVAAATANAAVGNQPDAARVRDDRSRAGGGRIHRRVVRPAVAGHISRGRNRDRPHRRRPARLPRSRQTRGAPPTRPRLSSKIIQVIPGPHESPLREIECEVTPQLDRVGIRLKPLHDLQFKAPADLPSAGVQFERCSFIPTVHHRHGVDRVTGGYLQPMTVISSERWKLVSSDLVIAFLSPLSFRSCNRREPSRGTPAASPSLRPSGIRSRPAGAACGT